MSTILLRLAAPLQAWGTDSRFDTRQTGREPTRSGLIGMAACAMGISREDREGLKRLNTLRTGVRVDREGKILRDYHIAKYFRDAFNDRSAYLTGQDESAQNHQTWRYYLSDAVFLAGLESDDEDLIRDLSEAFHHPVFALYLGRKSCPPTLPLFLGVREMNLRDALAAEPWLAAPQKAEGKKTPQTLRCVVDAEEGDRMTAQVQDAPVSFDRAQRQYGFRKAAQIDLPFPEKTPEAIPETEHDIMAEVGR